MKSRKILKKKEYPFLIKVFHSLQDNHQKLYYRSKFNTNHMVDIYQINEISQITVFPNVSSIWVEKIIKDMQQLYGQKVTFAIENIWMHNEI